MTLSNPVPLMEGEAGLYRTGSESCLPEAVERGPVSGRGHRSHDSHMTLSKTLSLSLSLSPSAGVASWNRSGT